jgi:nucleotide-binding universal stress UspA family protein
MNIVCGTDFSVHANKAVLASAALAARQGGTLSLVHVLDTRHYANPSTELMKHLRDSRQKKLDALADRARRRAAKVATHLLEGAPALKLTEFAGKAGAQLLVVSANGEIAPAKSFVGGATDQVVQAADIPTMVIRDAAGIEAWAYGKRPLSILIAYDFSDSADAALRWAASLREVGPCEISVAYVASAASEPGRLDVASPTSPLYYPSGLKKFLEQELRQKCDAVFGAGRAGVSVVADWGRPDSHLIELAGDARMDLIVIGTSRRRGRERLGSVSRAVVHYAHMNVACIPVPLAGTPPARWPQFERVLVPLDFSESDEKAVALAFASVRPGGEVHLVHVIPRVRRNGHTPRRPECRGESSQDFSARMEALVPKAARGGGIRTRAEVVEHNEPALAICRVADQFDADLICMAARTRPWFHAPLFGSVAQRVMVRSGRPVLITRSPGREPDGQTLVATLTKNGG